MECVNDPRHGSGGLVFGFASLQGIKRDVGKRRHNLGIRSARNAPRLPNPNMGARYAKAVSYRRRAFGINDV